MAKNLPDYQLPLGSTRIPSFEQELSNPEKHNHQSRYKKMGVQSPPILAPDEQDNPAEPKSPSCGYLFNHPAPWAASTLRSAKVTFSVTWLQPLYNQRPA